jgi:hypothetical protein
MNYIDVKNKKKPGDKFPPYGYVSWLDFWEKKSGKKAEDCLVMSCKGNADEGGHVIKPGEEEKEYILPLCHKHYSLSENDLFEALEDGLVPVD